MGLQRVGHNWVTDTFPFTKPEHQRLDAFKFVVLEKILESPLDSEEIKPVNPKEIHLEYSLEGLIVKLKLQYFGHLMGRANSLEKPLMLGNIEGLPPARHIFLSAAAGDIWPATSLPGVHPHIQTSTQALGASGFT